MNSAKLTSLASAAIIVLVGLASAATAQDNTSYPMVLKSGILEAMVKGSVLTSPVTLPEKQNAIEKVILSYEATRGNAPVELNVDLSYDNGKVNVIVDDNLLAKIKGQPVVFDITQRPVTEIVLKYDALPSGGDPIMADSDGKGVVFIRLSDTKRMAGKLEGLNEFKIKAAFGEITIPMSEIAGIKFHTTSDDKAVVVLNNGDAITGIPTIPAIELITDWGQADIEPEFIQSMTSTSGAKFRQQNTDFGVRWTLNTGNSLAPGALRN